MISVTLTEEDLASHSACGSGMALFHEMAYDGKITLEDWTPLHSLWLAVAYPGTAWWLREMELIPVTDLSGADLRSADLCGANLSYASMNNAARGSQDSPIPGWVLEHGMLRRVAWSAQHIATT